MWAIVSEGDKTTDPTPTEQDLLSAADETNGTYCLLLSLGALQAGETLEVRAKTKCRSGASALQTRLVSYTAAAYDASTDAKSPNVNVFDPPIVADISVQFTIKQLSGSARGVPWKVLKAT
jgi:hypothetical protein